MQILGLKGLRGTRRDGGIFRRLSVILRHSESRDCAWFTYRTVELRHWWEHRKNKLNEPQSEPMNVLK